jgi:transcriptional regulator with XRE-family HTH domain
MSKKELIVNRRLKGLMVEKNITIRELSKEMGISVGSLSKKINGRQIFFADEVFFVVKRLGFSGLKEVFPEMYYAISH